METTFGVLVFVILLLVLNAAGLRSFLRHYDQKEARLLKLISAMADRLQAKDLQGYLAVKEAEEPAPSFGVRNDEEEARLEQMRRG